MNSLQKKPNILNVAILDDGCDWYIRSKFRNAKVYLMEVFNGCVVKQNRLQKIYSSSHGTTCFAIYANTVKELPKYNVYCIKIIDSRTGNSPIENLVTALFWCLNHKISLISISLGTTCFADYSILQYILNQLHEEGCIVISAFCNNNIFSLPACDKNVIGVRCDHTNTMLTEHEYYLISDGISGPEIISSCKYTGLNKFLYDDKIGNYNSYACPYIAGLIHQSILVHGKNIDKIFHQLQYNSKTFPNFIWRKYMNKEVDFSNNLSIPIIGFILDHEKSKIDKAIEKTCLQFIKNNYSAFFIGSFETDKFYGFSIQRLRQSGFTTIKEMLYFLSSYTNANILFIELKEEDMIDNYKIIDIVIGSKCLYPQIPLIKSYNETILLNKICQYFS